MFNFPIHTFSKNTLGASLIPKELWEVPEPPAVIQVQGNPEALQLLEYLPYRGLAIVGTRNPQPRSVAWLSQQIAELEGSQLVILSGLARGIDAAAHEAALKAGLRTIGILGAGLDIDYPKENHELRNKILEAGGLIISEFPLKMPIRGFHFIKRNRLIAGWTQETWVVEAGLRSGSLNTARWAREANRTCFAVPSFPKDPFFAGNQTLLDRDHALAYWGTHSLGAVWMELISHSERTSKQTAGSKVSPKASQTRLEPSSDEDHLHSQVNVLCSLYGGAREDILLHWALNRGWTTERFFQVLNEIRRLNRVIEHRGSIVSV